MIHHEGNGRSQNMDPALTEFPPVDSDPQEVADVRQSADEPTHIVGLGASAGGLEALEQLFGAMPDRTGLALVVIQHLSPHFESMMDRLLARHTEMLILTPVDGMRLKADTIYLIPANKELHISGGAFYLTDRPEQGLNLPINVFFESLADDVGARAIGVVLSGTGSDGSLGVRAIHEAGGYCIVQTPESASFDGMIRSALSTGIIDAQVSPGDIPGAILKEIGHPDARSDDNTDGTDSGGPAMVRIIELLRGSFGIDFGQYKVATVSRRLERRMVACKAASLEEYAGLLENDPEEIDALYRDLLINVTSFFRDADAFTCIEKEILPVIVKNAGSNGIRIWVAGCATGEEAYTLAILLSEVAGETGYPPGKIKIFATDLCKQSVEIASAGSYSAERVRQIPSHLIERYLEEDGEMFKFRRHIRKMVVFSTHNLLIDPPFTRLDLVCCRNVLIYFDAAAQANALRLMYSGLHVGAYLFLGTSETPDALEGTFKTHSPHWRIYSKTRNIERNVPFTARGERHDPLSVRGRHVHPQSVPHLPAALVRSYDHLLAKYMPAGFLINEKRELLHTFGDAGQFLCVPTGRPTTDLIDRLDGNFKVAVSTAVHKATGSGLRAEYHGIALQGSSEPILFDVAAELVDGKPPGPFHVLVSFEQRAPVDAVSEPVQMDVPRDGRGDSGELITALELELHYARQNLETAVEQLESTNEELQSANEEMQASNEELQSTNEELHSVNEELYTVNAEHELRIVELTEANNDINNLIESTEIGTLFLDAELSIRRFTPAIATILNLLPQDVGRPVSDISRDFEGGSSLLEDVTAVLDTGRPLEREIQNREGAFFLLRIHPYRDEHDKIKGAVLAFVDVTDLKSASEELRQHRDHLEELVHERTGELKKLVDELTCLHATVHVLSKADLPFEKALSEVLHLINKSLQYPEIACSRISGPELVVESPNWRDPVDSFQADFVTSDGTQAFVEIGYLESRSDAGDGAFLRHEREMITDISRELKAFLDRRIDRESIRTSRRRLQLALQAAGAGTFVWDLVTNRVDADDELKRIFGEEVTAFGGGQLEWWAKVHRDDVSPMRDALQEALDNRRRFYYEFRVSTGENSTREIAMQAIPMDDGAHPPKRLVGVCIDITDRKRAEQDLDHVRSLLQAAIEQSPAGLVIADAESGAVRIANRKALDMLGLQEYSDDSDTLISTDAECVGWQLLYPDRSPFAAEDRPLTRALKNGEIVRDVETIIRRGDGTEIWALISAAPVFDKEGNVAAGVTVFPDITSIKQSEEQLRAALAEKEVLVREVHHRVKNNMNTISGLLYLQSRHSTSESAKGALQDCQNRILSMARVHEHLYRTNSFAEVNMESYIDILVADIRESYGKDNVTIHTDISGVTMGVDQAIPCGLIASELVSNAMKYAFQGRTGPNVVDIRLSEANGIVTFGVRDNGQGLPEGLDVERSDSLGLKLVQMLTRQLDGRLEVDNSQGSGAGFVVEFNLARPRKKSACAN